MFGVFAGSIEQIAGMEKWVRARRDVIAYVLLGISDPDSKCGAPLLGTRQVILSNPGVVPWQPTKS